MTEVALVLPPGPATAWVEEVVRALRESPATNLLGVVERPPPAGAEGRPGPWPRLYRALDRRLFDLGSENSLRADAPLADSLPRLEAGSEALGSVDLVLDLTLAGDPQVAAAGPASQVAWTIRFGLAGGGSSMEAAFAAPTNCYSASLWVRDAGESEARLGEISVGRLDEISLHRNLSRAGWRAAALVRRRLRALERGAAQRTHPTLAPAECGQSRMRSTAAPGPARIIGRMARRRASALLERDSWSIRLRTAGEGLPQAPETGHDLLPPPGRFYADPFLVEGDGRHHLLFEEYLSDERRGVISAATLDDSGRPGEVRRVLDAPHHLSYPFAFEHDGEHFMVPESATGGTVEIYRATGLPDSWQHAGTLLRDVAAYDPTLLEHAGRFWLWVATAPRAGVDADELRLYSSPELLGPYLPHPLNPVLSDVRCARPAGAILRLGDELLRPAQDGAAGYGGRIRWRRIEQLDQENYRESDAGALEPPARAGFSGLHTFNRLGGWEAFDLLQRCRRWHR
jgi:hypothetical protein